MINFTITGGSRKEKNMVHDAFHFALKQLMPRKRNLLIDFKIADIAMGSGHFLINAIDKMEIAFSSYLARRPLNNVHLELNELKNAAYESLGSFKHQVEIEDTQLLRRLIARRCVYGVDLNGTAVQLTRLAVWIHTFVPGLALSFLDHNLIQGNL